MNEVKWIKIVTDIFDNRKIKQIENMPEADAILVIWFKILCLAGNINESGMLLITKDIPYTEEMLANEFKRPISTVRLALRTFEMFGMIETTDDILSVSNWEKYQNEEGLASIREKNRQRQARFRAKKKAESLPEPDSKDVTSQVTLCNAVDIDKDKEEDIDKDKEREKERDKESIDYQKIVDMYNDTCVSFHRLRSLSESRKKAIRARLHSGYTYDDLQTVFEKAEASTFLKGGNGRDWSATFDWLLKDSNIAKVLEGNYDDKPDRRADMPVQGQSRSLQILKEMGEFD